ncbi:MAG: rhodanese-like domain-containing protein [Bacteroidota bacterium]
MDITVEELKQKLDAKEEFVFIDVREQNEYDDFNLGAKLVPLQTVPAHLSELEDKKDAEIVVHCRSGARSGQAQRFMQQNGFTNVRNLTGGVLAWIDAYGR